MAQITEPIAKPNKKVEVEWNRYAPVKLQLSVREAMTVLVISGFVGGPPHDEHGNALPRVLFEQIGDRLSEAFSEACGEDFTYSKAAEVLKTKVTGSISLYPEGAVTYWKENE
jgi:hypothetical protein